MSIACRPAVLILAVLVCGSAACTGDAGEDRQPTPTSPRTPVVSTGPVRFVPGEFVYGFGGITATLSLDGSAATMEVRNASGDELGPPGVYVIDGEGHRHDGEVEAPAPIPDGGSATFSIAFPDQVDRRTVGLVILEFGDSNVGAMAPRQAEPSA